VSAEKRKEEARDALIELFVLASSGANYRQTDGQSQRDSERLFEVVMRHVLEAR
jgi:hypothetical protein